MTGSCHEQNTGNICDSTSMSGEKKKYVDRGKV